MSSSESSRKRARVSSDPARAAPEDTSHEEEEETTNGHQIDPQQHHPQQQQYHQQQHHQQQMPPQPQGELQPSFFGIEPYDDFTRKIGDWIWNLAKGKPHVEIEAKVGLLRDSSTQKRLQLPVTTECVLEPSAARDAAGLSYYFDSDMSLSQHKHFNKILNDAFQTSQSTPAKILYSHLYELDTFHSVISPVSGREKKVRMRKNKKTGEVVDVVEKVRVGDLNVYCPGSRLDWRLSVSVEIPYTAPVTTPALQPRQKDRLSYSHQIVQVDLTQVITDHVPPAKRHELEVEVRDVPQLLEEAKAFEDGEENTYDLLLGVMLSSVRMLVKNSA